MDTGRDCRRRVHKQGNDRARRCRHAEDHRESQSQANRVNAQPEGESAHAPGEPEDTEDGQGPGADAGVHFRHRGMVATASSHGATR